MDRKVVNTPFSAQHVQDILVTGFIQAVGASYDPVSGIRLKSLIDPLIDVEVTVRVYAYPADHHFIALDISDLRFVTMVTISGVEWFIFVQQL